VVRFPPRRLFHNESYLMMWLPSQGGCHSPVLGRGTARCLLIRPVGLGQKRRWQKLCFVFLPAPARRLPLLLRHFPIGQLGAGPGSLFTVQVLISWGWVGDESGATVRRATPGLPKPCQPFPLVLEILENKWVSSVPNVTLCFWHQG